MILQNVEKAPMDALKAFSQYLQFFFVSVVSEVIVCKQREKEKFGFILYFSNAHVKAVEKQNEI